MILYESPMEWALVVQAVAVAEFQLPDSSHQYPGLVAIVLAVGLCAMLGGVQGTVVAKVGVPSFVVTLAGLLIFQGVILQVLEVRGTILIQDKWINDTAYYYFTVNEYLGSVYMTQVVETRLLGMVFRGSFALPFWTMVVVGMAWAYGIKRPNPSPRWFGFHEVFHSFTVLAFATHYVGVSMATYALR